MGQNLTLQIHMSFMKSAIVPKSLRHITLVVLEVLCDSLFFLPQWITHSYAFEKLRPAPLYSIVANLIQLSQWSIEMGKLPVHVCSS